LILLTVGTQLPFGRLVRAVDAWCEESGRSDVIAQIGTTEPVEYRPKHFEWRAFIPPGALDDLMEKAELIIAHAGMGSIISALQHAKPIVIMPRRADLGEHRSDHQQATAARFEGRTGIYVAQSESDLSVTVNRAISHASGSFQALSEYAEPRLTMSIRRFILTGEVGVECGHMSDLGPELAVKPQDLSLG
jgi:UDP-N-acetylglucosamine transferase subunit ALG13